MVSRRQLTEQLVSKLPPEYAVNIETALNLWWVNRRTNGGFRLTLAGYLVLSDVLDIESWTVVAQPGQISLSSLLVLDRCITGPYYLSPKGQLILFNSADAVIYHLYQDFNIWLKSLRPFS